MSTKKPIISIVGTTGVGKSQFSIDLARAIGGEIINADSMQVYQKLDQITNKHPLDERMGVPHHVIVMCHGMKIIIYIIQSRCPTGY